MIGSKKGKGPSGGGPKSGKPAPTANDSEKTVMANVGPPTKAPPRPPADDSEKTVMAMVGGPARPPSSAPPPVPHAGISEDTSVVSSEELLKGIMGGSSKPAAAAPAAPAADDDKTVMASVGPPKSGAGGPPPRPSAAPATKPDDDDKTVMAGVGPAKGGAPPKPQGKAAPAGKPDDDDKTVMAGAGPAKQAAPPPKPPPTQKAGVKRVPPAPDDGDDKTVMSDGSAPAKAAPKPQPPADERTSVAGAGGAPAAPAREDTSSPTSIESPDSLTSKQFFSSSTSQSGASSQSGDSANLTPGAMPNPGQRMNQYEIIRLLGEGGMGSVFLARDTKLGRRVAIKFLQSHDPELTQRFIIEARATARVEHENIVSIYEVGEWNGNPFMVLQYLQGSELKKIVPKGKKVPVPRVVELMMPVLRALDYAHKEGIVHRDLKPDNIFVTDGGITKVLDFGIAKVAHGEDRTTDGEGKAGPADFAALVDSKDMTRHGAIMGTMPYMSPEQWGNGVAIDHTTDIWAVGVMMYQMLCGKHPLDPLSGHELMITGFLDEPTPSLKEKAPELPDDIVQIIDKCLLKDKTKRWGDAQALLRALEPFQPGRYAAAKAGHIEDSPYAGLAAFQEEDASRFFGRNRESAAMSQRLRELPIMACVGPSGVGKSSFIRAGLVPALKNSGENWDIATLRPGRTPLMSLANLLLQSAGTSSNVAQQLSEQEALAQRLVDEPGYLGTALRRQARREKKHLMLFVDQFEELYTLVPDAEERKAFTRCLSAAADDATSPMRVVVSIRSDFLDRCVEDSNFMNEISQGLFFMTAPTRDGMRDAIVLPAEMAGYKFENEKIVDEMLDHLAQTSGALPLLQFTADRLWADRDPSRRLLTEKSYRALGGIAGALAAHADQVLEQIPPDQKPLVRGLLLRLVTPERTRAIVSMDDLRDHFGKQGDIEALVDRMVQARLLVVQTGGGGTGATVELVHESLINGWPQLSKWLDEGHEDAAFLEQLRNASRQWAAKDRDSGLLWRGEMVEEAKRFVRRNRAQLPDVQQAYLKSVIAMSVRGQRIRRTLYVSGLVVLAAIAAVAAVGLVIINESRAEAQNNLVAAKAAEEKATAAAEEAERRKEEAEKALNDARVAELAKDAAREAEQEALKKVTESKEDLAKALIEAQESEARAQSAKLEAEERAIEAMEARAQATKALADLKVAMAEVEQRRKQAEAAKERAEKRLKEMTRGGIVEVLQ